MLYLRSLLPALGIALVASAAAASAQVTARPAPAEGSTRTVTLDEARAEARTNSRSARAAAARAEAARQGERAAGANRWPTLGLEAGAMRSDDPVYAFGTQLRHAAFTAADFDPDRLNHPAPVTDWNLAAGASWAPLDFSRDAAVRAAAENAEAAGLGAEWAARAAEFGAVVRYMEALAAAERLETAEAALRAAEANLDLTTSRTEQGLLTDADLLQARAAAEGARASVIDANRILDDSRDQLTLALGWDGDLIAVPADSALPPFDVPGEVGAALTTRPDLLASEHAVRGAEAQVSQAWRARLPRLEGFAGLSAHAARPFESYEDNWTVGFRVRIPVFTGFEISAREKGARAMLDAARLEHADRVAQARVGLDGAVRAAHSATGRLQAAQAAAAAANEAARLMRRRFEEGLATVVDLLSAEARAAQMASMAVDARLAQHTAAARVDFLDTDTTPTTAPASSGGMDR